jgi:spermidine synthase
VYACLEIGIGISAIVLPFALSALNPVYRVLYNETGASNYMMSLIRFLMSAGILIVPTTMMGATLPVLSKFVVRRTDRTGANIGSLYAINTLGAVAGCFLAGFVLLGWLGMTKSEYCAASINILVGMAAFGMHLMLRDAGPAANEAPQERTGPAGREYSPAILRSILLIFCLSGMAALAYEVLWSRILVFLLGSSIYSFTMILVVYLLGLTAGSLVFARFVDRLKKPLQVFGWLEILIGMAALTGLALFQRLPFMPYMLGVSTATYLTTNFINTIAIVLPPTLLMGAVFPLAVKIYAR